jgi:hypothetical protein
MDDEIGSFFNELKELDVAAYAASTEGAPSSSSSLSSPASSSSSSSTLLAAAPSVVSAPAKVISKPAEIAFRTTEISRHFNPYEPAFGSESLNSLPTAYPPIPTPHVAPPVVPRQNKNFVRTGAGEVWVDNSLNEWPENDYRIFVGDLAKEITTEHLVAHFQHYKSFAKAKVHFPTWLVTWFCYSSALYAGY